MFLLVESFVSCAIRRLEVRCGVEGLKFDHFTLYFQQKRVEVLDRGGHRVLQGSCGFAAAALGRCRLSLLEGPDVRSGSELLLVEQRVGCWCSVCLVFGFSVVGVKPGFQGFRVFLP